MADLDDLARRSADSMWADDAASRMLGMKIVAVGPGTATVSMAVREDMINGWGLCHGGLVASLADSAFAVACNSHGEVTVAAGFDVSFLEAARLGDELVAVASERALRGRSGVYDVSVRRAGDDSVIAEFRGRSRSTGRKNPGVQPGA
jgi:acyl-CoA thioesterase